MHTTLNKSKCRLFADLFNNMSVSDKDAME